MGMPEIRITFTEMVKSAVELGGRGVVLLLVKDNANKGITEILKYNEIPSKFKGTVKKIIEQTFEGNKQFLKEGNFLTKNVYRPVKVIVYALATSETTDKALENISTQEFNYIAYPEGADEDNQKLIDFVKKIKQDGMESTAVISSKTISPDSEDVINFVEDDFNILLNDTVKAMAYTGRIAGLIAATPFTQSVTYAELGEVTTIKTKDKATIDSAIDNGQLTLCRKNGRIRIARGVNSLTTTNDTKGEQFKKIKIVNIYKFINNSIYKVIANHYIGKISNSYDNKCLLIVEIRNFLKDLHKEGLIESKYSVGINLKKQREYLKEKNIDVEKMNEQEIKEANTGSKVFLSIALKGIDAMEDFDIDIMV